MHAYLRALQVKDLAVINLTKVICLRPYSDVVFKVLLLDGLDCLQIHAWLYILSQYIVRYFVKDAVCLKIY